MTTKLAVAAAIGLLCLAVSPTAHHSFVVEYDVNRPLKLTGVVTKFEWINPHAFLHVDVVDATGGTTGWSFEMASPNVLENNGWTKATLKAGDRVSLEGYRSFALPTRGMVSTITKDSGQALVAGEGPLNPDEQ